MKSGHRTKSFRQKKCKGCGSNFQATSNGQKFCSERCWDDNRLQVGYGIDLVEYEAMVEEQGGLCKICKKQKKLYIDHDHGTGIVRGLLCQHCNSAIGFLDDDIDRLLVAARYLAEGRRKNAFFRVVEMVSFLPDHIAKQILPDIFSDVEET